MEEAKKYQELYQSTKSIVEARNAILLEEEYAYNNMVPSASGIQQNLSPEVAAFVSESQNITSEGATDSKYWPPDYSVTADIYSENMLYNFPQFDFEGSGATTFNKEKIDSINSVYKKVAFANNLPHKMIHALRMGVRKGIVACELVPSVKKTTLRINGKTKELTREGLLDLIVYNPNETYIDPNTDVLNPQDTCSFCIVNLGYYSKTTYSMMAEKNGWEDNANIVEGYPPNIASTDTAQDYNHGLTQRKGIKVSKLFLSDGMVQVVVNDSWIVSNKINAKMIESIPLIFYIAMPGSSSIYGKPLYLHMRSALLAKGLTLNLMLDNIGKNLNMPLATNSKDLANKNLNDYGKNDILYFRTEPNQTTADALYQFKYTDMTAGSSMALNVFSQDVMKVAKLDSLSLGTQGQHQIRTNYIAQQMSQPVINQKSSFIAQAEATFFQQFGRDMWTIFYVFYDKFKKYLGNITEEELKDITDIRVRQGSTLREDSLDTVNRLRELLNLTMSTQEDSLSMDKILKDYMKAIGFNDPDYYDLPIEQLLLKTFIKQGLDVNTAQGLTQEVLGVVQGAVQNAQQ